MVLYHNKVTWAEKGAVFYLRETVCEALATAPFEKWAIWRQTLSDPLYNEGEERRGTRGTIST